MAAPKINARLEHVTRKPERRKPVQVIHSWQEKLDAGAEEHIDPVIQTITPVLTQARIDSYEDDIKRLREMARRMDIAGKKQRMEVFAEKLAHLDTKRTLLALQAEQLRTEINTLELGP